MASLSTSPPAAPDPFDLGIHTPANLNRGARAALLQNSPATVNGTIGVLPVPRQMAQTPSSPLIAATAAAATEEAARANSPSISEQQPISIIESANDLAREYAEEYNAKLMVFQTFCAKFEEAAQQFATGPQRRFARQIADSFLGIWKRELSGSGPTTPKPSYSSVAAISLPAAHVRPAHRHHQQHHQQQQQHRQSDPPHRQGQQPTITPLRQDLRVFIRLEAGAPARAHSGYAIRTLIREKLGAVSDKIRQVFQVRSGWAVLAADSATRDFLIEKQAEWAAELKPIAIETNKEWFTYVVSDFPKRLTDFHGNEVDSDSIVSRTRPRWNQPTKDLPSSNQHLLQMITKAMNQAMRAIVPVWKTTPITILHRESGIPPVDQLLEARRLRFSARLKSLDDTHPLVRRTAPPRQPTYHDLIKRRYQAQAESSFRTRLRCTDELLGQYARPKLIQKRFQKEQMPPLQTASKKKTAEAFLRWAKSLDPLTLVVYSDGSLSP
ncbi:hypothetical protein FNYG_15131 [Fusarium nygamai]|uniref:Uncharacterized protein n=1 Tax=Gibberella nygamai TaxID=42673 RepID=A0A2K0UKD0_GIBNY|nr:hypothetical protein FNYG_15131 [Fusarium nygamai]